MKAFNININKNIVNNIKTLIDIYCNDKISTKQQIKEFNNFCLGYGRSKKTKQTYTYPTENSIKRIIDGRQENINLITLFSIGYSFKIPLKDFLLENYEFKSIHNKKLKLIIYEERIYIKSIVLKRIITQVIKQSLLEYSKLSLNDIAKTSGNKYIFELINPKNNIVPTLNTINKVCGYNLEIIKKLLNQIDIELNIYLDSKK